MNLAGKLLPVLAIAIFGSSYAQNNYDFKKAEAEGRHLVYTNPEAALPVIKETLRQKGDIHDTIYGNTYHLYGLYHSMKGNPDSTIYYIKKSLTFLNDYPRVRARSLFSISMAYRKKADYKAALKSLEEIQEINKKEKNIVGQAMVYGEMASNYNLMQDYDRSIELLVKAVAILKEQKNTKQIVAIKQKLANTYLAKENYKFAIDLYKECLQGFKEMGTLKNYYLTYVNMGEAYIRLDDKKAAKEALAIGAEGLKSFGDKELIGVAYSKIGHLEYNEGDINKALATYKKAYNTLLEVKSPTVVRIAGEYISVLNEAGNYNEALKIVSVVESLNLVSLANMQDRMVYKNAIADTYTGTNNAKEAIKAYRHTISIKDSIAQKEKETAVEEIQAKFQTELQREKNEALEIKNQALEKLVKTEQRLIMLYIFVSITVLGLVLAFLRGYKLKHELHKEALKAAEADKELINQQLLYEQELLKQQKETIDEKQRELTSTTLRMANYQDNINNIISRCESNELTKVAEVKKELQYLIKQKDYWKQFETRFNSLHPEFSTGLVNKYAKLTKNDLEFCSLLKLNLSNKEIASLLQISHESVITKKYRIKKKMEIADDSEFEKVLMEM